VTGGLVPATVIVVTAVGVSTMAAVRRQPETSAAEMLWPETVGAVPLRPETIAAAEPRPETTAAWDAHVAAVERRIAGELMSSRGFLTTDVLPDGTRVRQQVSQGAIPVEKMRANAATMDVPGGTIAHWRGSVLVPGVSVDHLLHRLQQQIEDGPHQADVLQLRVLSRQPDALTLFIRMTRTAVVTATFDTEHHVVYRRHGPARVSSRSVATRIVEVDDAGTTREQARAPGTGRGLLWRMHAYWRYEAVPAGVIVEVESMTLSRGIPRGLGVLVTPVVDAIARESMTRTLDHLRRVYGHHPMASRPQARRPAHLDVGVSGERSDSRIDAARRFSDGASAEPRRQARAIVRPGPCGDSGRTTSWPRRFSTGTAIDGSRVTPPPALTICTSVARLVARNPASCAPDRAQSCNA
jgi:hypothetical protein